MVEREIYLKNTASYGRFAYEQFVCMFFIVFIVFAQVKFSAIIFIYVKLLYFYIYIYSNRYY